MAKGSSRGPLLGPIVVTLLYAAALPFIAVAAVMSPMASDAGVNGAVMAFIYAMFTWPLAIIVSVVLAWLFYALRWRRAMWLSFFTPLLWLIPIGWSMGSNFGH